MRVFVECDPDDYYCRFIYGCTNVELSMSETMLKAQGIHFDTNCLRQLVKNY